MVVLSCGCLVIVLWLSCLVVVLWLSCGCLVLSAYTYLAALHIFHAVELWRHETRGPADGLAFFGSRVPVDLTEHLDTVFLLRLAGRVRVRG